MPIGTILPFVGSLADIPKGWHLCDGSDGTPDLTARFLEGTINAPGIFKEPGLPNIKGTSGYGLATSWNGESGAFYSIPNSSSNTWLNQSYVNCLGFDASLYSSIYKNDVTTVQPSAYTVYYIIKIK